MACEELIQCICGLQSLFDCALVITDTCLKYYYSLMQFFKVFSVALFHGEEIHEDLHLMVTQSPDESHVVVYGEV